MNSLFGVILVCFIGLILSLISFAAEFYVSWQHRMIMLKLQARRAIMDPLHLMAIANFGTSRIIANDNELKNRRDSAFLSQPVKIFPTNKRKRRLLEIDEEDDV